VVNVLEEKKDRGQKKKDIQGKREAA